MIGDWIVEEIQGRGCFLVPRVIATTGLKYIVLTAGSSYFATHHMVIHSPVSVFFILFFSAVFLKRRGAAHDSMRCCANASDMRIPTFQMHRICCPLDVAL